MGQKRKGTPCALGKSGRIKGITGKVCYIHIILIKCLLIRESGPSEEENSKGDGTGYLQFKCHKDCLHSHANYHPLPKLKLLFYTIAVIPTLYHSDRSHSSKETYNPLLFYLAFCLSPQ